MNVISPRVPKGFRDSLPDEESLRMHCIRQLERTFQKNGYIAIDTPILEYADVLLGAGGGETEKQIYRFTHANKHELALRFDLTVPLARFIASHHDALYSPFRRYHIAKVFRGENTQQGRYREFYQCDFDIVGTQSIHADFETARVALDSLHALGIEGSTLRLSHTDILPDFLKSRGHQGNPIPLLRIIDKLRKIGVENCSALLQEEGLTSSLVGELLQYINNPIDLSELSEISPASHEVLNELMLMMDDCGYSEHIIIDPSITRGLHYYTGMVFECFLREATDIGSICSGGRYDNLASRYTKKHLPGVGASVGLDRLLVLNTVATPTPAPSILLAFQDRELGRHYQYLAQRFREAGMQTEVYPQWCRLAEQFQYAEKKGISHAIICGSKEFEENKLTLRTIQNRTVYGPCSFEDCLAELRKEIL